MCYCQKKRLENLILKTGQVSTKGNNKFIPFPGLVNFDHVLTYL